MKYHIGDHAFEIRLPSEEIRCRAERLWGRPGAVHHNLGEQPVDESSPYADAFDQHEAPELGANRIPVRKILAEVVKLDPYRDKK